MKVLFLISGGDTGGAKTHVFALLDKLRYKCDVKLICFMDGVFYRELLEKNYVDTSLFEQKSRFDLSVLHRLEDVIKQGNYDIVHSHGARANFIAARLKRKISCPVITTMHSDYLLDFDGFYRKLVFTTLNIWALSKMDYFIAVSSSFKRMLVKRNFEPNRIFTVYNGMDFEKPFAFDEKKDFLQRVGCTAAEDDIFVGIIGRHDFVKGHDVFMRGCVEVAKRHRNVKFLLAGDHEGEEALRQIAAENSMEDRFVFCGFIKDIYSFINAVDINVITSRSESFPYMMLEGARMKKPTVSSRVGGIPDLIVDNETGLLFESENHMQFAQRICELIENPQLRENLGTALYERATGMFSSENLACEHMKIYESVLKYKKDDKKYDVVLSGYYGFDNMGDDALLFSILHDLKKLKPDIRVLVLTNKPVQGRNICLVDTAYRFNPFALHAALKKNKLLISGGGSLIQDATSAKSLYYYIGVMRMSHKCGNKIFVFANGIGPIDDSHKKSSAAALCMADSITLRDKVSAQALKSLCPSKPYEITADPAIGLKASKSNFESLKKEFGIPGDVPLVGVSLRTWQNLDTNFEEKMIYLLRKMREKYAFIPVFIPMKYSSDLRISERIQRKLGFGIVIDRKTDVDETVSLTGNMDVILGMRLHTLIFAAGNGVPCVGITYDPKVAGFMEYIGQRRVVSAEEFDAEKTFAYIEEIMQGSKEIKKALSEKAQQLSKLALRNCEIAVDILERNEE